MNKKIFINYAHRGASAYAPENTMSSFRLAIDLHANGIELDLQKTKDNKIFIFHDDVIDHKSNGKGKIEDYTYEELYELDFGSWFNDKYKGEHIVLFDDFAKEFLNKNMTFAIELKAPNIEKQTLDILNKYPNNNIYITSATFEYLENIRKLDKNIKISWLIDEEININNINKLLKINGNQICPKFSLTTIEGIELARLNHIEVRLWGIGSEEKMEKACLFDTNGMTVNFPDKLANLIDKMN